MGFKTKRKMKLNKSLLTGLFLTIFGIVNGQPTFKAGNDPKPTGTKWFPVRSLTDEFNEPALDTTKWTKDPVSHGWDWQGRPPGLFLPKAVQIKNGHLAITVGKLKSDTLISANGHNLLYKYQGGIVRATNPGKVGYYYECRLKMNRTEMGGGFWIMSRYDCQKKHEIDITESVGQITEQTQSWAKDWTHIMHSNTIHRQTKCNPESSRDQKGVVLNEANSSRYFVYGAWWKSPRELLFYLDGKYMYTLHPPSDFDLPSFIHMDIECYDWNPIPEDGGKVVNGKPADKVSYIDWVRTWKLVTKNNRK